MTTHTLATPAATVARRGHRTHAENMANSHGTTMGPLGWSRAK